jgi:transcriptional regulator with GAF, ATPase, and Fis domain
LIKKWGLAALGIALLVYGLVVVGYSHQTKEIGLRSAFDTAVQSTYPGYLQRELATPPGTQPEKDDTIKKIGSREIHNWSDYLRALASLRSESGYPVERFAPVEVLNQLAREGHPVVRRGGKVLVRVVYEKPGDKTPQEIWSEVKGPPNSEFLPSLSWFLIKLGLLLVGATVFWKRSNDPVAVQFYLLCVFNVGAFMGGYHWHRISQDAALVSIFIICAVLLAPVSLHFYSVFPRPKPFLQRHKGWFLTLLYGPSLLLLAAMLITMTLIITVHRSEKAPELVRDLQQRVLLNEIYIALALAGVQFAGCVLSLAYSFWSSAPESRERQQVKWILAGASVAAIPIGYTLWLAVTDTEALGLGGATWPMFMASVSITLAYGVGISRYGFLDVGQLINRSILPVAVSLAVGLAYALIVFVGMLVMGESGIFTAPLQQATWVSVAALVMLTLLDLARGRIRTTLDRRLNKTRVQLDETLKRMSLTVEQQLDPPTICKRFLLATAELIEMDEGAIYLRTAPGNEYRLVTHVGKEPQVASLAGDSPLLTALEKLPMVRLRTGGMTQEPALKQLRDQQGELALPLRFEQTLLAVLIVGHREHGALDIPTLHLLTTFAQIAGMALHGAEGHAAMESLNRDLQDKVQKISEQQRRIVTLQSQLLQLGASKAIPTELEPTPAPRETASSPSISIDGIVGSSTTMRNLLSSIKKVAQSQSAVLIRGESGTGKELLAKALHEGSTRAKGPFVKVHCAALAPGLLESELFGHVKGAFTGAIKDKPGRFELADKGTLFLDEIGDITLEVQTKLLRVLQEMTFERVGSSVPISVDVRIIAATNQDLEKLMKEGRFREDLFFRLNVITVRTPPLRERPEDVLELADHFLRVYSARSNKPVLSLDDEAAMAMKAYAWPGNVRELENVIERAVVLAESELVTLDELPGELTSTKSPSLAAAVQAGLGNWELGEGDWSAKFELEERQRLIQAMTKAAGNKSKAARALGMPRSTFVSKMEKHGLLPRRT